MASTDGTTLTLSDDGVVSAGHTLLIEDEQVYVESVATGEATVQRGVNRTTAANHGGTGVRRSVSGGGRNGPA